MLMDARLHNVSMIVVESLDFWEIWAHLVALYFPCTLTAQNISFPLISWYKMLYTTFNAGLRLLNLLQTSPHTTSLNQKFETDRCVCVYMHLCIWGYNLIKDNQIHPTGQLFCVEYLIADLYSEGKPPFIGQQWVLSGAFITSGGRQRVTYSAGEISHSITKCKTIVSLSVSVCMSFMWPLKMFFCGNTLNLKHKSESIPLDMSLLE